MRLAILVALVASCGPRVRPAPPPGEDPDLAAPEPPPPPPQAPAVAAVDPPPECGGRTWRDCTTDATASLAGDARQAAAGMRLLRASCEEGDRRRCFERDSTPATQAACDEGGHADACHQLARLYEEGRATCAPDGACAAMLETMACLGGVQDACR